MPITKEKLQQFCKTYLPLFPLLFAVGVIPLIVRIHFYDPELSQYSWFSNESNIMDMFLYWKNKAMILLDFMLLVGYGFLIKNRQLPKRKIFIPLSIYALMIVVSTIWSVSPYHTWVGFWGMMESAYVLFGYCMICYYAAAVVKTEKDLKIVMIALMIGVFILGCISFSQFIGKDVFMSVLGKDLIFPAKYAGYKELLRASFGTGRVYATLYNPNYVGIYSCLLLPLFMVLTFTAKKKEMSALYFVLVSLLVMCIVGAGNKTAVLVLIPTLLFVAIYFGKKFWKKILITYVLTLVVFVGCNMMQGENSLIDQVLARVSLDSVLDSGEEVEVSKVRYDLQGITLNNEDIEIIYNDESLRVRYLCDESNAWTIEAEDSSGNAIPIELNDAEDGYRLSDERYEGLEFVFGADGSMNIGFSITAKNKQYFVYYSEEDATYYYTNYYGKRAKIFASETYQSPVFKMMGGLSGRGYIWSKSVPLLKDTLLVGSGPDTFAFMFPQYDYVSLKQNGWEKQLITKPHSMYLQIGVETGVVSLIAVLAFYICYFVQSIQLYWKREFNSFTERCGAAIWIGSICYMMSAMLNDSTIGVSIIFWSMIGMGIACNQFVKSSK